MGRGRGKGRDVGLSKLLVASKSRFGVVLCVYVPISVCVDIDKCIKIGTAVKERR